MMFLFGRRMLWYENVFAVGHVVPERTDSHERVCASGASVREPVVAGNIPGGPKQEWSGSVGAIDFVLFIESSSRAVEGI